MYLSFPPTMFLAKTNHYREIPKYLKQIEEKWKPKLDSHYKKIKIIDETNSYSTLRLILSEFPYFNWKPYKYANIDLFSRPNRLLCNKSSDLEENIKGSQRKTETYLLSNKRKQAERLKNELEAAKWTAVYRFPYIAHAKVLCRLKLYQSMLTFGICGYSSIQFIAGNLSHNDVVLNCAASFIALCGLVLVGNITRKLIGAVYVDDSLEQVRMARLTFFGNREDIVVPRESIVDLLDNNTILTKFYFKLKLVEPENVAGDVELYHENFNLSLKFGGVLDESKFEKVFGRILDYMRRVK